MQTDLWLERWIPFIRAQAPVPAVLELGSGPGGDSAYLVEQGITSLICTDVSPKALARCARAAPGALTVCHDLREPLPFAERSFNVVIASLCLHYFAWDKTGTILRDIARCLTSGGILLCRLNSTRDVHYGAVGHEQVGQNYYLVDGFPKRFFDRESVDLLFAHGWERISTEELSIARYEKPKIVWEVILRQANGKD
ncbi:class I SAM-dependent methyltransferase [Herbaspirillum sp. GCM10030257]|uniref:class I SAM-dependent methyltransferase n=1 Tax=Herbaspirillum sp. GCM10030257 TaxID=3273393 RepID=UPI0036134519